jgi:hypothetical protein
VTFKPCNVASPELTRKIRAVEPSKAYGQLTYPCAVVLKDGRKLARVACIEEAHGLYGKDWIPLEDIQDVEESVFRLPAALASQIYAAGESGMGYSLFTVQLASGDDFVCVTGSALVDFPELPAGIQSKDIVEVLPDCGRERTLAGGHYFGSARASWCYFVGTD